MKRILVLLAIVSLLLVGLAGCTGSLAPSDVGYADTLVDNMLQGLKNRDYATFSRDFAPEMLTAINESNFNTMADQLLAVIGEYQSKKFAQASKVTQDGKQVTVIVYNCKFSNEPANVLVTVSFTVIDDQDKIVGLYFNSPKLRGE